MSTWALLLAAGRGERLRLDRPKAFARLRGRPLVAESLERLEASEWIDAIVVAAPAGWEEPVILLAEELGCGKVAACVAGGATRTASARAALAEVPSDAAVVLVHDAARPLLDESVVDRLLGALGGWDAVVPAIRLPDTVKRVRGEEVVETLARDELVSVQTPQAFMAEALRDALAQGTEASDCAALVEDRRGRVRVVEGDARLMKVTVPHDLALLDSLLAEAPAE